MSRRRGRGAGIAGLAAAFRLRKARASVTVLEAGQRPSGRMDHRHRGRLHDRARV